jgi:acetolactate synthase-1/2/3 large subunit
MRVADYIARFLAEKKVSAVFELTGGMIAMLLDSIHRHGQTSIVSMHHEQGAAFAAEACGRISHIPSVAMASSGPGALNLLTGVGSCYFDSTPAVFITGQVNRFERKGGLGVRQLGFQETDVVKIAQPIVKRAWSVEDPEQVPMILEEAFSTAISGRPGPVLIDIPMDVQRADIDLSKCASPFIAVDAVCEMTDADARSIRDVLLRSQRPMILAGGGIQSSNVAQKFLHLVELAHVPVVHSLMAVDALPFDHKLNAGMIGTYGNRWSNLAISESDFLLVLGSRLDIRQTGADTKGFKSGREIYHIDCDASEMNNRVKGCHCILSHLDPAISMLAEVLAPASKSLARRFDAWTDSIDKLRAEWPDIGEQPDIEGINPNRVMHQLSRANPDAAAYVVDVGQHQMWAAQSIELQPGQRFLTSGGMGSMGFALPTAIGAAIAYPNRPIVMIAGDGSFQCNIQELETVYRLGLPLKMVVINNQCLGMLRQFQQSYLEGRYQSSVWGYSAPDFAAVATAYGIPSKTVADPVQMEDGVAWISDVSDGPMLLQVMVLASVNAYPKLAYGKGMSSMEPLALPEPLVLSVEREAT